MTLATSFRLTSPQQELLKYAALLLMLMDHAGANLFGAYENLGPTALLGRLVFPIFAFLLIYNYLYNTSDKAKYVKRLLFFAVLSQLPYSLAFIDIHGRFLLNALFTLGIGLGYIYLMTEYIPGMKSKFDRIFSIMGITLVAVFIMGIFGEYSLMGFLTVIGFYLYMKNGSVPVFAALVIAIGLLNMSELTLSLFGVLSLLVIYLCSRVDINLKRIKGIWFYYFYPAHLLVIAALSCAFKS